MKERLIKSKGDVWDDIIDDQTERKSLRAKSHLMMKITQHIETYKLSEQNAADQMEVSVEEVNNVLQGKINKLDEETLSKMNEKIRS